MAVFALFYYTPLPEHAHKLRTEEEKAGEVARTRRHMATGKPALVGFMFAVLAATALTLVVGIGIASGAIEGDASTIGIGQARASQSSSDAGFNASEKLGVAQGEASSQLTQATQRSITVTDPEPVVELAAVDLDDANTVAAAAKVGVLNPPKTAKRLQIDTTGEGWMTGQASGYDVATSSTLTRSGREFNDDCVTVAVPEGQEDLLGHPVIIVYEDKVVVATVTDTGGFAKYGRVLDLGGGVHKAFGFEDIWEWGVREVHYKFL